MNINKNNEGKRRKNNNIKTHKILKNPLFFDVFDEYEAAII